MRDDTTTSPNYQIDAYRFEVVGVDLIAEPNFRYADRRTTAVVARLKNRKCSAAGLDCVRKAHRKDVKSSGESSRVYT